jgi:hypothetical protein
MAPQLEAETLQQCDLSNHGTQDERGNDEWDDNETNAGRRKNNDNQRG